MTNADEIIIFQEGNVKITNLRVVIGTKTYAMSSIASVSMTTRNDKGGIAPLIAIFVGVGIGFCSLLASMNGKSFDWFTLCAGMPIGLLVIGMGIYTYVSSKPVYFARFGSSSGEVDVLQSKDMAQIKRLVDAVNEAIVRRG